MKHTSVPVSSQAVESVVRRYFATVADLTSSPAALGALLSDDLIVTEHPNALCPAGATRDLDATLAGFSAGKSLLSEQGITVHEVLVDDARAAVRATWRGVVTGNAGPFTDGQELVARIAAWLTVRDGLIVEHETFDCYEPFDTA